MVGVLSGPVGRVCWGYQVAATVRDWTMTRTEAGWVLQASLVKGDTFRLSKHPLVFTVREGCQWPVASMQMVGTSCTATLGPMEVTSPYESTHA